jgi:hypothetical protein
VLVCWGVMPSGMLRHPLLLHGRWPSEPAHTGTWW